MSIDTIANDTDHGPASHGLLAAGLAALGIVYGDIGTSPLYAFKVALIAAAGTATPTAAHALGVLSLIIWSLLIVISLKYVVFVMRADNHGEGGILALLALLKPWSGKDGQRRRAVLATGIFGAALLYGDGVITPAISVMSAVEGLDVVTPMFAHYVKLLTAVILIALFVLQRRGTAKIGNLFGPVMVMWFFTIAVLGVAGIARAPQVLRAIDPFYAIDLMRQGGAATLLVFGAVFLAVTGGEALYSDMGHIGRQPIRMMWFVLVLPALLLNYAGQAALILAEPGTIGNPFFRLAPTALALPVVVLATAATVIASQALISGVFSLTRQAIHMGMLPRMRIFQTSAEGYGQIYLPVVNWGLMAMTLVVVMLFKNSDSLAAAYGIAVSGTMVITAILLYLAMREVWHWPATIAVPLTVVVIAVDGS
ncbi:MAG: KUP/HAK/KT family potassium transporter, partial [Alphaproteobacteria bacterium]|nr:KUP/HAK/KT family potassium transporter [Alphaproteobacteria bacterium]